MNLANKITLARILLIPLFVSFLIYQQPLWALVVFVLTALTDAVDGFIARSKAQRTKLGSFLDPLADKLLMVTSLITLAILKAIPPWFTIVVVSRDSIVVLGVMVIYLFYGAMITAPSLLGKSASAMQMVTIAFALLFYVLDQSSPLLTILALITVGLTLISGLQYVYHGMKMLNKSEEHLPKTSVP